MSKRAWMQRSAVAAMLLGGLMSGQAVATASAATVTTVNAVHKVYLRRTPHLGWNGIVLEPNGEHFSVVQGSTRGWWHVKDERGRYGYVIRSTRWIAPQTASAVTTNSVTTNNVTASSATTVTQSGYTTSTQLPPGVTLDSSITPVAPLTATWQQKFDAVLSIAQSKLGTPYEWGHNEDRGQYGFDCSNFTAYVFHHALGYKFSGASQVQNRSVGTPVPASDMRPGDLLIFENGAHVGIYIGNGEMIEEGGGLGKVGYLSVKSGSYWGNHLTSVRRMF